MTTFYTRCLETARRETREVTNFSNPNLPKGQFIFTELYCDEPECKCNRVIFLVQPKGDLATVLATLNYGWESAAFYAAWSHDEEMGEEMARLVLEPLGQQSEYSEGFRRFAEEVLLADPAYVERLKRHYAEFRATLPRPKKARGLAGRNRLRLR